MRWHLELTLQEVPILPPCPIDTMLLKSYIILTTLFTLDSLRQNATEIFSMLRNDLKYLPTTDILTMKNSRTEIMNNLYKIGICPSCTYVLVYLAAAKILPKFGRIQCDRVLKYKVAQLFQKLPKK